MVYIIAVKDISNFETERVPGREAHRDDAGRGSGGHEGVPDGRCIPGGDVELEAVLARVSRPRHERRDSCDPARHMGVVGDRVECGVAEPQSYGLRPGTLDGDQGGIVALVGQREVVRACVARDPGPVLVEVRRVHDHEEVLGGDPVYDQVVDDASVRVAHRAVERPARLDIRVVREEHVEECQRLGALQPELAHVRQVEQPGVVAHGHVLGEHAGVLNGHEIAGERLDLRPERHVSVV